LRIAIDARELEGHRTGVGRYLHEVLRAWARDPDAGAHEFVLCSTGALDRQAYEGLRITSIVEPGRGVWWEQLTLPRILKRERPDLLFAPGYTSPLCTVTPTVLVVHDVSFSSHPEWFSWREGARRRTITRLAAHRAASVVTVSHFSKSEIEAHLGIAPARISVIPNGVTRMSTRAAPDLPDHTVLYVGSIFNRRHVPALIDAVALLARRGLDVRLEIVGDNRTSPRIDLAEIALAAGVAGRVRIRSYVPDAELAACYSRARAFAFLSEYEGFGLTPLEALSAGVPIVVLDSQTTREVYGDAATFVVEPSPHAIANGLERALVDDSERRRVLGLAEEVLARHSWTTSATRLLELFARVAHARGTSHAII
jgi:glycosyltransferase involved in cell wall biosynthesis